MASGANSVWAIDLGNSSLKALHLKNENGVVTVIGFDNIAHGKVLNGSGVKASERDELIAMSLRQFVQQNDVGNEDVVVSVPSQNSFARFVKLPPVEKKRIPEIVKFEAAQQIPFDINDVQWDWQQMSPPEDPEIKVGIFAIKNEIVMAALEHFGRENIRVKYVQMAPMALYNYGLFDRPEIGKSDEQAVVIIDIGCENTDLVVCTKSTVWQRCIPMGGNAFTKAVAEAFKLNFEKAEKLKRTAPMSKYARQIFQAMRPVFTDLASEIQRSLGFYTSSSPGVKLTKVIALGGGTRMRGLLQYLQQTLQIPVERPDAFGKLTISPDVSAAEFHENVSDFGVVYGLALQGLGLARLEDNLLPRSVARSMMWASKAKYFTAAACVLLVVSLMCFGRTMYDKIAYRSNERIRQKVKSVINSADQADDMLKAQQNKAIVSETIMQKAVEPLKYRDAIPLLQQTIVSMLPNEKNTPVQQELYMAFDRGDVKTVMGIPRNQRKQIFVTGMSVSFTDNLAGAAFGTGDLKRESKRISAKQEEFVDVISVAPAKEKAVSQSVQTTAPGAAGQAGFVVTLTGYSPYKNIGELMDPVGVENDPNKWGVITRLLHLKDIVDGNSPFELYGKTEIAHFNLVTGDVSPDAAMPYGIGVLDVPKGGPLAGETVLVDPMTREIISKVPEYDEHGRKKIDRVGSVIYTVNDHWFRLSCKFIWKDAPKSTGTPGG